MKNRFKICLSQSNLHRYATEEHERVADARSSGKSIKVKDGKYVKTGANTVSMFGDDDNEEEDIGGAVQVECS